MAESKNEQDGVNEQDQLARQHEYVLCLFVTGATPNSTRAIDNIKKICEDHLAGHYRLEIVDLYQDKGKAESEQIVAVPMLVKQRPLPKRKLIGDMSNKKKITEALGLKL